MTDCRTRPLPLRALAAGVLLVLATAAAAAPEDDFKEGLRLYHRGDMVGAMDKLRPAADAGHGAAMALLADVLDKSGYVDEAVDLYKRAAERSDPDGQYGLGALYAAGRGVPRDDVRAYELFEKAANAGHKLSLNTIAQAYMAGGLGRKAVSAADTAGLGWIERSAGGGHLPAVDFLAQGWRNGSFGAADLKKAEAYEKQADQIRYAGKPPPRRKRGETK